MKMYFVSGTYLTFIDNLKIIRDTTGINPFPVRILISYLDVMKRDLGTVLSRWVVPDEVELFLDSGAYGAFTRHISLDVQQYGEWIKRNQEWIHVFPSLDVIRNEEKTVENQKRLEDMGLNPLPVFHARESLETWGELVKNYEYICLGALVGSKALSEQIGRVRLLMKMAEDNSAKVHMFGVGRVDVLSRLLPFSADSSTFLGSKYGAITMWDERTMSIKKVKFRSQELVSYEHLLARYGLPTAPLFMRRPGKYGYGVIRAFEYLQFQRMGEWIDAIHKYRMKEQNHV